MNKQKKVRIYGLAIAVITTLITYGDKFWTPLTAAFPNITHLGPVFIGGGLVARELIGLFLKDEQDNQ